MLFFLSTQLVRQTLIHVPWFALFQVLLSTVARASLVQIIIQVFWTTLDKQIGLQCVHTSLSIPTNAPLPAALSLLDPFLTCLNVVTLSTFWNDRHFRSRRWRLSWHEPCHQGAVLGQMYQRPNGRTAIPQICVGKTLQLVQSHERLIHKSLPTPGASVRPEITAGIEVF